MNTAANPDTFICTFIRVVYLASIERSIEDFSTSLDFHISRKQENETRRYFYHWQEGILQTVQWD